MIPEHAIQTFAGYLAGWGAATAFIAIWLGGIATGDYAIGFLAFWPAFAAACVLHQLGTTRSTSGRWL